MFFVVNKNSILNLFLDYVTRVTIKYFTVSNGTNLFIYKCYNLIFFKYLSMNIMTEKDPKIRFHIVVVVVVVVVVGQTVGSISSRTLAYDCLYTLELLCTASMIATS